MLMDLERIGSRKQGGVLFYWQFHVNREHADGLLRLNNSIRPPTSAIRRRNRARIPN
jgi:hypothetical protein